MSGIIHSEAASASRFRIHLRSRTDRRAADEDERNQAGNRGKNDADPHAKHIGMLEPAEA